MVDFKFYTDTYHGGSISDAEWPSYETQAAAQLARYKRKYKVTAPDENAESMAVCAMAEAQHNADLVANGEGGPIQSASIGSVNVSYGGSGSAAVDVSPAGVERALYRAASVFLEIYRGVC